MLPLNEQESFSIVAKKLLIYTILVAKILYFISIFNLFHLLVELSNFHNFLKVRDAWSTGIVLAWEHQEKHILHFTTV